MPKSAPTAPTSSANAPRQQLSLFDSTCIIVGIIVAAGIYRSSSSIAAQAPSVVMLLGFWLLGGVLSLLGAVCYVELATAYPHEGGDYVYLTRALGRPVGFVFAWAQLWIVRPGSIGAMAYAFADYANQIYPRAAGSAATPVLVTYAAVAVILLSVVNFLGIREGKWTQNGLTAAKVIGLLAIILVGLSYTAPAAQPVAAAVAASATSTSFDNFGMAMIFVLFTYGGWSEMAFVSAEVRDPHRNIFRAMLLGTVAVTVVYLLVNMAFIHALGLHGLQHATDPTDINRTPATDVLELALGHGAGLAISLLICISALGAINGQIFTGARIYYAMGADHRLYSWLGHWNVRRGQPVRSLIVQTVITLALVVGFGLSRNGFDSMVKFTTPAFWAFLMLVGASLFVLRYRDPATPRPFRVPGYPVTPVLFCLSSAFMVYSSLSYAITFRSWEAFWSLGLLAIGIVLSFFSPPTANNPAGDGARPTSA